MISEKSTGFPLKVLCARLVPLSNLKAKESWMVIPSLFREDLSMKRSEWSTGILSWGSNQRESRFSRILEIFFEISPLDLGLEVFQFHFHFSKRVKQKIISLFISRKEWKEYLFHFSFLEKSESISDFTLFLEKKEWNCACYSGFCHEKFKGIGNVEY